MNKPTPSQARGAIDSDSVLIEGDKPLTLGEIRDAHASPGVIEVEEVTGANISNDALALEAFMNEVVTIVIAESVSDEDLPVIVVGVNGINQPIVRGVPTPVKRKYVEALARAKETKYRQSLSDPSDPGSIIQVPRTALAYPFSIERDANPNGRAWLARIIQQPA
jgi:hypothetical protein